LSLKKGNPFIDFITLQEKMSKLFDEAAHKQKGYSAFSTGAWSPAVDIFETDGIIILSAELPGVDIKDVDVEVNKNVLTLRGERKFQKNLSEEQYLRMERFYGTFQRVFNLPVVVDKEAVKANFKDGVLRVILPKIKSFKSTHIKIEDD
jgi:HSP20 family protein